VGTNVRTQDRNKDISTVVSTCINILILIINDLSAEVQPF
jgi:hypothetical protein